MEKTYPEKTQFVTEDFIPSDEPLTAPLGILQSVRIEKTYGASLLKVATNLNYIDETIRIGELAAQFQESEDLMVVGICDEAGKALGMITRVHFFSLLGKPFGREILSKKPIRDIMETAQCFDMHDNLFHVAEQLQDQVDRAMISYYLLVNREGGFAGIFSSKDLLFYLSRITQEDIALAGQLQGRLVKNRASLQGEHWNVESFSQSAKGLGGDFYFTSELPSGKLFVALGDVSGKGAAASILTSLLWGILEFYDFKKGLKTLLLQVNEALIRTFHLEKYLTGIFFIYDPAKQEILIADMGHGHGFILRDGVSKLLRFPHTNLPLGIDLDLAPQLFRLKVHSGDLILLYTDGLPEQENLAGEEFGTEKFLTTVNGCINEPEKIPEAVQKALAEHQGEVPRLDDVTWLQLLVK